MIQITLNTMTPRAVFDFCDARNPFNKYYFDIHSMEDLLRVDGSGQTLEIRDEMGEVAGLIIFEIVNHVGGRELEVREVAFEPVSGALWTKVIWPHLFKMAWEKFDCDRIGITSETPAMTRLLHLNGFKILTTTMVMEVAENVRIEAIQ
jgi:hypothetical protein